MIDNKRVCEIDGCNNVGEWSKEVNGKIYRRRFCTKHRGLLTNKNPHHKSYAREKFKNVSCGKCEYCGWEGPCDVHRPNKGKYTAGNMRSACPNCHRLISLGLIKDKFIDTDKLVC